MQTINGHLDYYKQHGINPVRYDTSNLQQHFERRASLYRSLGVLPLAIRGARVLEVAPGTGQNSRYLAKQRPASLTLVEPNPVARRDIAAVYADCEEQPELVLCRFEEFDPEEPFDLVVCENWLGNSEHERGLLRKLGGMVAESGLLVVTAVSPVGVLPNLMRRALSNRLTPADLSFDTRTAILNRAFAAHLRTVGGMTRNVTDWVHDNMLNPAYLGVILTVPMVLQDLSDDFDVLSSSPRFGRDWRWFKSLCGEQRDFNHHMLAEYFATAHNLLDHRTLFPERDAAKNESLESAAFTVATALQRWEAGEADSQDVEDAVRRVMAGISDLPVSYSSAFDEFLDAFANPELTPEMVAELPHFGPLFGRETLYLSFEKK